MKPDVVSYYKLSVLMFQKTENKGDCRVLVTFTCLEVNHHHCENCVGSFAHHPARILLLPPCLNLGLQDDPEIPLLDMYPKEI